MCNCPSNDDNCRFVWVFQYLFLNQAQFPWMTLNFVASLVKRENDFKSEWLIHSNWLYECFCLSLEWLYSFQSFYHYVQMITWYWYNVCFRFDIDFEVRCDRHDGSCMYDTFSSHHPSFMSNYYLFLGSVLSVQCNKSWNDTKWYQKEWNKRKINYINNPYIFPW